MIADTNAVSALAEGDPDIVRLLSQGQQLALPTVVLGEYQLGISRSRHRAAYEHWLRDWMEQTRILCIEDEQGGAICFVGHRPRSFGHAHVPSRYAALPSLPASSPCLHLSPS